MEYTGQRSLLILFFRSDYGSEFEVASADKSLSARIVPWMQSLPAVTFPLYQIIRTDQTREKNIKGQWVAVTKETVILIFKVLNRKEVEKEDTFYHK